MAKLELFNPYILVNIESLKVIRVDETNKEEIPNDSNLVYIKLIDFLIKYKKLLDKRNSIMGFLLDNHLIRDRFEEERVDEDTDPCEGCSPHEVICENCPDATDTCGEDCNPCDRCEHQ